MREMVVGTMREEAMGAMREAVVGAVREAVVGRWYGSSWGVSTSVTAHTGLVAGRQVTGSLSGRVYSPLTRGGCVAGYTEAAAGCTEVAA